MEQNLENKFGNRLDEIKTLVESLLRENEKQRLKAEHLERENEKLKKQLKNQEIVKDQLYKILEKIEQL